MEYLILISFLCILVGLLLQKKQVRQTKKAGIRVVGTIIHNQENSNSFYQLGGNINHATIQFFTKEGVEIIGKPLLPFVSQHELIVPAEIDIIYDAKNPASFCVAEN